MIRTFGIILAFVMALSMAPTPVRALDRDVRAVIVAGEYGLLGGTVLGLASLPFTQEARSVFIGSSLGLYLGIAVGVYYVFHRYDPNNPLRFDDRERTSSWRAPTYGALEISAAVARF